MEFVPTRFDKLSAWPRDAAAHVLNWFRGLVSTAPDPDRFGHWQRNPENEITAAEYNTFLKLMGQAVGGRARAGGNSSAKEAHSHSLPALQVSANRRFLVRANGRPFFWLADTGWCLFTRSPEARRHYLHTRAQQGFTVIQAMAIRTDPKTGELWKDVRGDTPFDRLDPVTLNERYWRRLDALVEEAASNGLYVALFTMWGRDVDTLFPHPVENNYRYGQTIARRYRHRQNVLWAVCGEYEKINDTWKRNPAITADQKRLIRALARGVAAGRAPYNLMTIHPIYTSSRDFHEDAWLDFNMQQTWGHIAPDIQRIGQDYRRRPAKPVLNGEPGYENRPQGDCPAWHLRLEGYWSVFSGAFGFTYGAHTVWQFDPGWKPALDWPGATQMRHLRALLESRPFLSRAPDQKSITSKPGSLNGKQPTYRVATRAADGSYLMVYSTRGLGFTVDLSKVSGPQANAWWYNPRDGQCYDAAGHPTRQPFDHLETRGPRTFNPPGPSGEGRDWVLVLDDARRNFPAPGSARVSLAGPGSPASGDNQSVHAIP